MPGKKKNQQDNDKKLKGETTNDGDAQMANNEQKSTNLTVQPDNDKLKFIDLCCGIGGFHQALTKLGMECVMASDIDENCQDTYEKNYGIKPEGDLSKIEIKNIQILTCCVLGFRVNPFLKPDIKMVSKMTEVIYSSTFAKSLNTTNHRI